MPRFEFRTLQDKITRLLRACSGWLGQFGRFGSLRKMSREIASFDPGGEFRWVFDPERQVWFMEASYSFRSLECRLQAGEADVPSGIGALRRILGSGS